MPLVVEYRRPRPPGEMEDSVTCKPSYTLLLVTIILLVCLLPSYQSKAQPSQVPDGIVTIEGATEAPLPDSLGGNATVGNVLIHVLILRTGRVIGYEVVTIHMESSVCERVESFGIGAPSLSEAVKRGSIHGESVLKRYTSWIEENFSLLTFDIDTLSISSLKSDTLYVRHDLIPNRGLPARIDSVVRDYIVPRFFLPDSLGGRSMRGLVSARVLLDSSGEIKCWFPTAIFVGKTPFKYVVSYVEASPNSHADSTFASCSSRWIRTCLHRIHFAINKHHSLFTELGGIPLTVHFQLNAKVIRHKNDLRFLLE